MGDVVGLQDRRKLPEPLWRELVGRTLRAEREARGERLTDVAAVAGVSMQYLSEVERGMKDPSSEVLAAVTGALGLRLVDLTSRISGGGGFKGQTVQSGPTCLAA